MDVDASGLEGQSGRLEPLCPCYRRLTPGSGCCVCGQKHAYSCKIMHQNAEKSTIATTLPTGNPRVRPVGVRVLADDWYVLRKATFDFRGRDGRWSRQEREAYDRGNG